MKFWQKLKKIAIPVVVYFLVFVLGYGACVLTIFCIGEHTRHLRDELAAREQVEAKKRLDDEERMTPEQKHARIVAMRKQLEDQIKNLPPE